MRLDYIDQENTELECNRLIRLYDFTGPEVEYLRRDVLSLASGSVDAIQLHRSPYIKAKAGCEVTFKLADKDYGICALDGSMKFECRLTPNTWKRIRGYMEPFLPTPDVNTFQWLDESFQWADVTSDTCFLFSPHPKGYW